MARRIIAFFAGILCLLGLTAAAANAAQAADSGWSFPAPAGLTSSSVKSTGDALSWKAVKGPNGQIPASYTIETFQLNGVKVDQFTKNATTALEYGKGGKGLHPGWSYRTYVWANGGPVAPNHSTIQVALKQAPAPTPTLGYTKYADNPNSEDDVSTPPLIYPEISGTTGDIQVDNDVWSPPEASWSQALYVANAGNWYAAANFPTDTSVHSFANTGQIQDWIDGTQLPAKLSSWSSIVSSYSVTMPTGSGDVGEAAYDIWLNSWNNEVMIQTDFVGDAIRPRCDVNGDVTLSQTFNGQKWNLCQFDDEIIWQPPTGTNYSSDTIDVMAMLQWLADHGNGKYLPAQNTLTGWGFGFEICGTGGQTQNWVLNSFSFKASK